MKATTFSLFTVAMVAFGATASAAMLEGRIGLGTQAGDFFEAGSGFTQGDTSHTNTMSFNDGVVQVDFTLTVEAFDAADNPAGLSVNNQAAGVELGVNNTQIDPGESIKVTYDSIVVTVIGMPGPLEMVDPSTIVTNLSSARLTAFTPVVDTFTYEGVNEAGILGDDTQTIEIDSPIVDGDMLEITADSGAFRWLFLSHNVMYDTKAVPEPTTFVMTLIAAAGLSGRRRG